MTYTAMVTFIPQLLKYITHVNTFSTARNYRENLNVSNRRDFDIDHKERADILKEKKTEDYSQLFVGF